MVIERRTKLLLLAVIESGVGSELLQTELRKIYFQRHLRGTLVAKSRAFVHEVPGVNAIERWIEEAKALPGIVTH